MRFVGILPPAVASRLVVSIQAETSSELSRAALRGRGTGRYRRASRRRHRPTGSRRAAGCGAGSGKAASSDLPLGARGRGVLGCGRGSSRNPGARDCARLRVRRRRDRFARESAPEALRHPARALPPRFPLLAARPRRQDRARARAWRRRREDRRAGLLARGLAAVGARRRPRSESRKGLRARAARSVGHERPDSREPARRRLHLRAARGVESDGSGAGPGRRAPRSLPLPKRLGEYRDLRNRGRTSPRDSVSRDAQPALRPPRKRRRLRSVPGERPAVLRLRRAGARRLRAFGDDSVQRGDPRASR